MSAAFYNNADKNQLSEELTIARWSTTGSTDPRILILYTNGGCYPLGESNAVPEVKVLGKTIPSNLTGIERIDFHYAPGYPITGRCTSGLPTAALFHRFLHGQYQLKYYSCCIHNVLRQIETDCILLEIRKSR